VFSDSSPLGGAAMLEEEGYRLMGAAFEVYNQLGYGMAEEIYQQSLEIELSLRKIPFRSKHELVVFYKDRLLDTHYQPDLVVYDTIIVELKAISDVVSDHEAQLFNYMRIARQQVGYLLNFGKRGELQWKRFILSDLHSKEEGTLIDTNKH
jgi:GxxExxY protein